MFLLLWLPVLATACPSGCSTWFDGCNICQCNELGESTGCTRRFCKTPAEPHCRASFVKPCVQGDECGGQVWTDCGSACPRLCGQPEPVMCVTVCTPEAQCGNAECFDETTGRCANTPTTCDCCGVSLVVSDGGDCPSCKCAPPARACCEAFTPECVGCAVGLSAEEYCVEHPETPPCVEERMCCLALRPECEACQEGITVEEFLFRQGRTLNAGSRVVWSPTAALVPLGLELVRRRL